MSVLNYQIQMSEYDRGAGLAGGKMGQVVLGRMIAEAPTPKAPTVAFLNFADVAVATASFVRACVVGFRDYARQHIADLYPVVTNASETVLEDLDIVLVARGDAMVTCTLEDTGIVSNAVVLGHLEPRQRQTLEAVCVLGEVDAARLFKHFAQQVAAASPTAWNNRLAALAAKGLVVELLKGRGKFYRCIFPEVNYGIGLYKEGGGQFQETMERGSGTARGA